MTYEQIYATVNAVAQQVLGSAAITAVDVTSFASLGTQILSNGTTAQAFRQTLVDRIGRTMNAVRDWEIPPLNLRRNEMEYGCILQKISFEMPEAKSNPSWDEDNPYNPYEKKTPLKLQQWFFKSMEGYSFDTVIYQKQLKPAFISPEAMGSFINGIYLTLENKVKLTARTNDLLANGIAMGWVLANGKPTQKRNLIAEYLAETDKTVTVDKALMDRDFLTFASMKIRNTIKDLGNPSTMFNSAGYERQTGSEYVVTTMLERFNTAFEMFATADVFHKELIELPKFESISYWQGTGTDNTFENLSTINLKIPATDNTPETTVKQSGIIAHIHDYESVASLFKEDDTATMDDQFNERTLIMRKGSTGYMVDQSENAVVFYLEDTTNGN